MFYELEKDSNYPDVWYNNEIDHFISIVCPIHDGHQRGTRNKAMNLSIEIKKKKFGDFVSTVYSDWIITDHVAEILSNHELTGYKLQPIDVCNMILPYRLWELVVIGKGGEAHPDSGITRTYHCEHCNHIKYRAFKNGVGIIVDESNWDGSDFFTVTAYPKFILVNEKVKSIIEENNLKGALLVPTTELTRNEAYSDEVSPY